MAVWPCCRFTNFEDTLEEKEKVSVDPIPIRTWYESLRQLSLQSGAVGLTFSSADLRLLCSRFLNKQCPLPSSVSTAVRTVQLDHLVTWNYSSLWRSCSGLSRCCNKSQCHVVICSHLSVFLREESAVLEWHCDHRWHVNMCHLWSQCHSRTALSSRKQTDKWLQMTT